MKKGMVARKTGLAGFSLGIGSLGMILINAGKTWEGIACFCLAIAGLGIREVTKALDKE